MDDTPSTLPDQVCRLCGHHAEFFAAVAQPKDARRYHWCRRCGAIGVDSPFLPDLQTERERYREHNNQPDNPQYLAYLRGFLDSAIRPYVATGARVLDFGSGPEPVLSTLLRDGGWRVASFDPFFAPDPRAITGETSYDAVVLLEVIEHLHHPGEELSRLNALLASGGRIILRTGVFDARDPAVDPDAAARFLRWWYRRDITHVFFLTPRTIHWIQRQWNLTIEHWKSGVELVFSRPL